LPFGSAKRELKYLLELKDAKSTLRNLLKNTEYKVMLHTYILGYVYIYIYTYTYIYIMSFLKLAKKTMILI
jgi:hypothetical protein